LPFSTLDKFAGLIPTSVATARTPTAPAGDSAE
jgi:hypothetical protein